MHEAMEEFVAAAQDVPDARQLTVLLISTLRSFGLDQIYYRHVAWQFRSVPAASGVRIIELKRDWSILCRQKGYSRDEPMIAEARRRSCPYRLSEVSGGPNLTARQREFLGDLQEVGYGELFIIPVFHRPGDFAFFALAAPGNDVCLDDDQLLTLQSLCNAYHARYNDLEIRLSPVSLSTRETQVLELIAKGGTNLKIARSLGVSVNTVDTLIRRCFNKLGVTTRIEAALAAISRGLILP
jgi:DNA-binding CsgD family transcriptional regulator